MIVVAGEALVDLVQDGDVWRPVPGGGPFNTAVALRRLGQPAAFLGTLSNDDYGASLFGLLVDAGVDVSLIRRSQAPTPLALVHRHDNADNTYAFYLAATALTDLPIQAIPELTSAVSAIHLGTLALGVDPPAAAYEALLEREAARRAVVIDPNVRPSVFGNPAAYRTRFERLAALAQVVKLSDDDAAWIYPEYETADVLDRILALGPRLVAITLGAAGAVAASGRAYAEIAAVPVTVVDTVGAGDSFGAALLAALVEQGALPDVQHLDDAMLARALSFAATAAAITCTRTGAVPPSRAEVESFRHEKRPRTGSERRN